MLRLTQPEHVRGAVSRQSNYIGDMAREELLSALGGTALGELVPLEFLSRSGLSLPAQYGMVCADVAAQAGRLEALGSTPFVRARLRAPGWTEGGARKKVSVEMALGYSGSEQIELLGPALNTRFYSDTIPADGALALHHVCCYQNNLDRLRRQLPRAGYALHLEGGLNVGLLSIRFACFDTRDQLGFWLKIAQFRFLGRHRPPTQAFVSRLARLQRRFS